MGYRDRGGEQRQRERERVIEVLLQLVGNLPSSSFHLSSLSLSHVAPSSLTQLHPFTTQARLSAPFSSLSFTLCVTLPPCLPPSLSPCRPLHSPPRHSIPLSFTGDLGSHSLSLPFMKLLMLFPAPTSTPPVPGSLSCVSVDASSLSR